MWIVGGGPTPHEGSAHSRVAHDHKMRPFQNGPSPRSPGGEECAPPEARVLAAGITPLASADHLIAWRIPCAPGRITLIGRHAWRNASMSLSRSAHGRHCAHPQVQVNSQGVRRRAARSEHPPRTVGGVRRAPVAGTGQGAAPPSPASVVPSRSVERAPEVRSPSTAPLAGGEAAAPQGGVASAPLSKAPALHCTQPCGSSPHTGQGACDTSHHTGQERVQGRCVFAARA